MRLLLLIITLLFLWGCQNDKPEQEQLPEMPTQYFERPSNPTSTIQPLIIEEEKDKTDALVQHSENELISFLDSVGQLESTPLVKNVRHWADSIFLSQQIINKSLSPQDFSQLKKACRREIIDFQFARKIFGDFEIDKENFLKEDSIFIHFVSFHQDTFAFKEFAVSLGYPISWSQNVYIFNRNFLISKLNKLNHYGSPIFHFKDSDGKVVIYYKANFTRGSGIWWYNRFFYKYDKTNLIPILNELENANLQFPWHIRKQWIDTTIEKWKPLTIKFVYDFGFKD